MDRCYLLHLFANTVVAGCLGQGKEKWKGQEEEGRKDRGQKDVIFKFTLKRYCVKDGSRDLER
jgi:hypothetical protein